MGLPVKLWVFSKQHQKNKEAIGKAIISHQKCMHNGKFDESCNACKEMKGRFNIAV